MSSQSASLTGNSTSILQLLQQGGELPPGLTLQAHGVQFFEGLKAGHPEVWMTLGLLILIGLPIARVALAGIVFLIQRDYLFVLFCSLVLVNLVFGLLSRSGL